MNKPSRVLVAEKTRAEDDDTYVEALADRCHLDKLVERDLLTAHYAGLAGRTGRGSSTSSKLYEPSDLEVNVSIPERRYDSIPARTSDTDRTEAAVEELLDSLGVDLTSEDTRGTPRRVAAMYREMLTPEPFNFTTFDNADEYDELVLVRDIPFVSLCAHHLLPFKGHAHVAYVPGERIVGLSKLARAVHHFAKALQVQERLTKQVAELIQRELEPKGVGVVMEAEHQCMTVRGVQAMGTKTVTSTMYGLLRDNHASREEFLSLAGTSRA